MCIVIGLFAAATSLVANAALGNDELTATFAGNEAVSVDATGQRRVEFPPYLKTNAPDQFGKVSIAMPRWDEALKRGSPGPWYLIEGAHGLRECGGLTLDDNACRQPTIGVHKWRRIWIVKLSGQWVHCVSVDAAAQTRQAHLKGALVAVADKTYRCADRSQITTLLAPGSLPE